MFSTGCHNSENSKTHYINKTLADLEQIKSATYFSTENVYIYDDTISFGESTSFFKEFSNPTDTLVGCAFVKLFSNDTTKMDFLYDGTLRARVDWERESFQTDDFKKSPNPIRQIYPPFFTRAKNILNFALESTDSLSIEINYKDDFTHFRIEIYDEIIEFLGIIPIYEPATEPFDKIVSVYEIWFDKKTNLPFRIIRNLPYNTFDETIEDLAINQIKLDDFFASDYYPINFDTPNVNGGSSNENLAGETAPELYLIDIKKENKAKLKSTNSKVTLIVFTSTNCGACHNAIPFLQKISEEYNENEFELISIECGNISPSNLLKYKTRNKIDYDLFLTNKKTKSNYCVELIPSFYILNENKEISKVINGFTKDETDMLIRNTIDELI